MSGVSLPVTRQVGRALLVGSPASRVETVGVLGAASALPAAKVDDPHAAMAETVLPPADLSRISAELGKFVS